jgi:hypothetical protein
MGTDKTTFVGVLCGGAIGSHVTGRDISHVTGSDVSHVPGSRVTGRGLVRKYAILMRNRKLRNIRLVRPFDRKLATGSAFPRFFLGSSTQYWLGCSLRRPCPINLLFSTNWPFYWLSAPSPPFYFHIL